MIVAPDIRIPQAAPKYSDAALSLWQALWSSLLIGLPRAHIRR
jgi:hypothetical protein